jgi:hypothetical protein
LFSFCTSSRVQCSTVLFWACLTSSIHFVKFKIFNILCAPFEVGLKSFSLKRSGDTKCITWEKDVLYKLRYYKKWDLTAHIRFKTGTCRNTIFLEQRRKMSIAAGLSYIAS